MAIVEIESVHPLNNSLGSPLQSTISVVFNQLMDESTISSSTFLVSGPDSSTWSGPDLKLWESKSESPEDMLSSFNGESYVPGSITFETIDSGTKTKAIFTADQPLREDTQYTIYLTGDEGIDDDVAPPIAAIDVTVLVGTYAWRFTTGSGSIQEVPETTSNAVAGDGVLPSLSAPFDVQATVPANRSTGVDVSTVTIQFNRDVDSTTVNSAISIYSESVNGDPAIPFLQSISYTSSVSGGTITLSLTDTLLQNNAVIFEINSLLLDADGNALTDVYEFYFTTTYSPLYVTSRRIKLDIGAQIAGIPDDTINLAIFEASRNADILSANATVTNLEYFDYVKRQFVICEAEGILLQGISSKAIVAKKKLADFSVEYDGKYLPRVLERVSDCLAKWEPMLRGGGDHRDMTTAIKGLVDPNRPDIGRTWESSNRGVPAANTKGSYYTRWISTWSRYSNVKWLT